MGPVAAKSYPGPSWSDDSHRPRFRPEYWRNGYIWVYGALAHREGEVFIETVETRNTQSWLHFLDGLEDFVPDGDAYLIADALPLHWTIDTMLWNWGHPRFHFVPVPKKAAWLNLIEGFWKILGQRGLDGRLCENTQQVAAALRACVTDWNRRPTPFIWGRKPRTKRTVKRVYAYRL